jgi:undecaprenyl-diphosphatase
MILGLSRIEAARFSFLLAIPITLGIGLKELLGLIGRTNTVDWGPIIVGAGVTFVVALIVIHYFLKFISKHTLWPFIWYTMLMSLFVGYLYLVA